MTRPLVPTEKELEAWRRLIGRVNGVLRDGRGSMASLSHAALKANRARMPVGHQQAGSAFAKLAELTRDVLRLSPQDLDARRARISALAADCAAILTAPTPPERPVRRRADLDD